MANPEIKTEGRSVGEGQSSSNNKKSAPLPKDAQVMAAVLKDMGVADYDPRVLNQLLEFSYRYVTNVLEDARCVSAHARKKQVDLDDVRLAAQLYAEQNVTAPPSRDVLLDMAAAKNNTALPIPKATCGLRLPPDRHCLTACNYRVRFKSRPKPPGFGGARGYAQPVKVVQPRMVGAPRPAGPPGLGPKPVIKVAPAAAPSSR